MNSIEKWEEMQDDGSKYYSSSRSTVNVSKETPPERIRANQLADIICDMHMINKQELSSLIETHLKDFMIESLKDGSVGLLEREKIKIMNENNTLQAEKIRIADKRDPSNENHVKQIGLKISKNQTRLHEIGLLQKSQMAKRVEMKEKRFRDEAYKILPTEMYELISKKTDE